MSNNYFLALIGQQRRLDRYAFLFLMITFPLFLKAQACPAPATIVCNDQVNLSIPNGAIMVTVNMVAENIPVACLSDYEVNIYNNGTIIGNEISCTYSGQVLQYSISHIATGISCHGNILIEDKSGPNIICNTIEIPCSQNSSVDSLGQVQVFDNCDPNPSLISFDNLIDFNCTNANFLGVIERTWIATDSEGNSSTCVQNINIIRPDITGLTFPADITISCTDGNTDPTNTGGPSVAEILSSTACNFIVYFEDSETSVCTGTTKIIRRWYVTDWCTGDEIEHTQLIIIEDNVGPDLTCPTDLVFGANESSCDATVTFPEVIASDSCSNVVSVIPSWEFGTGNGPFENIPFGEYPVVYTAEDECGNTSTCATMISIIDNVVPVAICDLFTVLSIGDDQSTVICADDIDSGSYDNCELASRAIRLVGDSVYTECITVTCAQVGQSLAIEMQVVDIHNLENHCTVNVDVFDKIPPVISNCAANITISCDEDPNDLSLTGTIIVNDNCNAAVNFTDVEDLNECNVGEITRTFTATDNSGNTAICTQTITTVDNTAPIIQFSEDLELFCISLNDEIGKPTVEDNCGKFAFSFTDVTIEDNVCLQRFTRTWEVLNLCTDERVSKSFKITLQNDLTLPEFSGAPTDITTTCDNTVPEFIAPTITDACDDDLTVEISTTDVAGTCPERRILTRIYTAIDDCGNSNSFTQTIRLIDNQAPTFVNFPLDQTINCDETISETLPEAIDNCDNNPTVTFTDLSVPGECQDEVLIFRTFTAMDDCGNSNSAIQLFRFVDDEAPIIRGQTQDFTIFCEFPIPVFDLGAIDNCDDDLTIEIVDTSVDGDCPNEEFITRIYTVTDDCGNEIKDTTLITVVDESAPELFASNLDENLTILCSEELPIINFTVTDNCDVDAPGVVESRDTSGTSCALDIVRTFTATDACGNATSLTQNIRVIDDQAPIFFSFPQNQDVTISSGELVQVDVINATADDNCTEESDINFVIDFFSDGDQVDAPNVFVQGNNASGLYPLGTHTVSFNTSDDCGNTRNRDLLITVIDFSPSTVCTGVTLEIGENGLLLVNTSMVLENPNISNNGSIVSADFVNPENTSEVLGASLLFNCDMLGVNQFAIRIIDNADEVSICSNMIDLVDPDTRCDSDNSKASIAGKIIDLDGMPMSNVVMNLTTTETKNNLTDRYGVYAFNNLDLGSNCQVDVDYDNNHAEGVTTFDMVLMAQHILQIKPFDNPYQHLAADVDLNGKVDLIDMIEIRSLILFQTERFSASPSHRFIEKDYQFSNPENPLLENIPDSHLCPSLEENIINLDFYSIKMGDIDGTKIQSFNSSVAERSDTEFTLSFHDQMLEANEITEVMISTSQIVDPTALQFSLDLQEVKILEVVAPKKIESNLHHQNNKVHFAWTQFDGDLPQNVFTLRIKANRNVMLSEILQLDQNTPAIHFNEDGHESPILLESVKTTVKQTEMVLQQNTPNPFSDFTNIKFHLNQSGAATLQVTDLAGKIVYRHQDNYTSGWHEHRLDARQLTSGIYIYTLAQGQNTYSKKLVITN